MNDGIKKAPKSRKRDFRTSGFFPQKFYSFVEDQKDLKDVSGFSQRLKSFGAKFRGFLNGCLKFVRIKLVVGEGGAA